MTGCAWDHPGADRYTGTVAAAVAAYGLPQQTQAALVAAWERRQFADHVVIDRDSIRGQSADYRPEISAMHFGSRGKVCDTVTRAGWAPEHAETAVVLCADGECVAVPAVCTNVFRLTRIERGAAPAAAVLGEAVETDQAGSIGASAEQQPVVTPQAQTIADGYAPGSWGASAGFGYGGAAYAVPPRPAPCPAVPEPGTWSLLAAGLALMAWKGLKQ